MTHPLTDDIIHTMWGKGDPSQKFEYRLARASADWQLERVIEWLQANLWLHDDETGSIYIKEDFLSDLVINEELIIEDLKKSMRPQEDN